MVESPACARSRSPARTRSAWRSTPQAAAARREGDLRDGRQERRRGAARRRPGQGGRRRSLDGAFGSTGQRCTATSRVDRRTASVARRARGAAGRARPAAMKVGPGLDETIDMGPAVDEQQLADRPRLHRAWRARRARGWYAAASRPEAALPGLLRRADDLRRRDAGDAHLPRGGLRAGAGRREAPDARRGARLANAVRVRPHRVDLHPGHRRGHALRRGASRSGMVHVNEPTVGGEAQLPFGGMQGHRRGRARDGARRACTSSPS